MSIISAAVFAAAYSFLEDSVRPTLEGRRALWLWWLILGLFLVLLFTFACFREILQRPKFFGAGFVLLATAVYCYDPTINSYLAARGLGHVWVAWLGIFFIWLGTLTLSGRHNSQHIP